jgi:hypothetical protein
MKTLIAISILILITGIILIPTVKNSNCGGNSAALSVCQNYVFSSFSEDYKVALGIDSMANDKRKEVQLILDNGWLSGMDYMILKNNINLGGQKIPLIVCCKMYFNVPQPSLGNMYRKTHRHAVGFSDGSSGLWTEDEFSQFDWGNYVKVSQTHK